VGDCADVYSEYAKTLERGYRRVFEKAFIPNDFHWPKV